jgi:DNA topoisomerase-1
MEGVLSAFWAGFEKDLASADEKIKSAQIEIPVEETEYVCELCGSRMIVKNGRYGKFAACPNYPKCKNTKKIESAPAPQSEESEKKEEKKLIYADFKCEKCGSDVVQRVGKYGAFFACVKYPECDFTKQKTKDIGVPCPKCGSKIIMKNGRNRSVFYSCEKYPACDFSSWDMPVGESCPMCHEPLFRKKGQSMIVCHNKSCGFKKPFVENGEE